MYRVNHTLSLKASTRNDPFHFRSIVSVTSIHLASTSRELQNAVLWVLKGKQRILANSSDRYDSEQLNVKETE